jgi:hypothetical protein
VQKGGDYILFIKLVFGGKGHWIDAQSSRSGASSTSVSMALTAADSADSRRTLKGLLLSPESFTMFARIN